MPLFPSQHSLTTSLPTIPIHRRHFIHETPLSLSDDIPKVHFFCDIPYDVFRLMRDNELVYGFNMNILDDARSFPSLWPRTRAFVAAHPHLVHPEADLDWLLDPRTGGDYNNCQFFSNFEIGSLEFFRGEANERYFEWLDRGGGEKRSFIPQTLRYAP